MFLLYFENRVRMNSLFLDNSLSSLSSDSCFNFTVIPASLSLVYMITDSSNFLINLPAKSLLIHESSANRKCEMLIPYFLCISIGNEFDLLFWFAQINAMWWS